MTLDVITSPLLAPLRHGFFGRAGGASSGVFRGLNCGFGSSDQHEAVAVNRSRAARALDLPPEALLGVTQTHSSRVTTVTTPDSPRGEADALVTAMPGLGLSILTADCQPILFADTQAGVIGAAHAGWRGALDGVIEATVDAMEALGARRDRTAAAIGPTISQRAYEVGPEFLDRFVAADPAYRRFFADGAGDRLLFDLPGFGLFRLRAAGVNAAEWTRHCTYSDPDRFFSYRRSIHTRQADYGRMLAAIRL